VGSGRSEPRGTATVEELVRHHDTGHRFARVQSQPGGIAPMPVAIAPDHFGGLAQGSRPGCGPGGARPHWGQHPHCPRCPHSEACPHCARCPYQVPTRVGFQASPPAPYHQQSEFWQPRWVDQASPATAVWNPFSGFIYWNEADCRWVQISPKR
jgi:hypothetical protein